ncbi:MAG: LysM peptidoglycan-binding domain-containing protein [Rhodothermales bacterium]
MTTSNRFTALVALLMFVCTLPLLAQEAKVYTVKQGDTLFSIAQQHGLSMGQLRQFNDLPNNLVKVGQLLIVEAPHDPAEHTSEPAVEPTTVDSSLIIPVIDPIMAPPPPPEETPSANAPLQPDPDAVYGRYIVERGDTMYRIARQTGVPVDTLLWLNPDLATVLPAGAELKLPARFAVLTHTVKRGETLFAISRTYKTDVATVRAMNGNLSGNTIRVGQTLQVPANGRAINVMEDAPTDEPPPPNYQGTVSVYPAPFEGRAMANARPYDPAMLTVSHATLPFGTVVLLTNTVTGYASFAEVTDRTLVDAAQVMDVSQAVAEALKLDANADPADVVEIRVRD